MTAPALTLSLLALSCAARASAFSLTVKGDGGCTGFQYTIKKDKYSYNATLGAVDLGAGCTPEDVFVSKLYIPGACAKTRTNNFGFSSLNPKNLNCDTVDDYSEATCNRVLKEAPRESILTNITEGEYVDYGDICWHADVGFVFVQNRCANDSKVAVEVEIKNFEGSSCHIVKGVGLSKGQIAGIVIVVVVVVILIALVLFCCCCQLRKG